MKQTPTPWKLKPNLTASAPIIIGNGREIAMARFDLGSEDDEVHHNAEHIVKCVNAHDELMEFIKRAKVSPSLLEIHNWAEELIKQYGE